MKRLIPLIVLVMILAASCGKAPQVAQGTVAGYDAGTKILILKNESSPHQELTFSLQKAEYGVDPAVGDSIRLAFRDEGGALVALRIMNLSKQKESKKKGEH